MLYFRAAVDRLMDDGLMYSTVDDAHYKIAE